MDKDLTIEEHNNYEIEPSQVANGSAYNQNILNTTSKKPVVVMFHSTLSGSSSRIAHKVTRWFNTWTDVVFLEVDIDKCIQIATYHILVGTELAFDQLIWNTASKNPVIIMFYSTSYGPSYEITSKIAEMPNTMTDIIFLHVDIDKCVTIADYFKENMATVPNFLFLNNDKIKCVGDSHLFQKILTKARTKMNKILAIEDHNNYEIEPLQVASGPYFCQLIWNATRNKLMVIDKTETLQVANRPDFYRLILNTASKKPVFVMFYSTLSMPESAIVYYIAEVSNTISDSVLLQVDTDNCEKIADYQTQVSNGLAFHQLIWNVASKKPMVVMFYSPSSGPSKAIASKVAEVSNTMMDIIFLQVDIHKCKNIADYFNENEATVPSFLLLDNDMIRCVGSTIVPSKTKT